MAAVTTDDPGQCNGADYPQMPGGLGSEETEFDLAWISGLHKAATNSLNSLYGDYSDFKLNADDPLNFEEFDQDVFLNASAGPIIYLAAWLAVLVIIAITGICWCCCNKCCCCCISNFKGKNTDEFEDRSNRGTGRFSARNARKESGGITTAGIVASVLMAVWLIGFLIMILHTFASNDKMNDGVGGVQQHLENSVKNLEMYMDTVIAQLEYLFNTRFNQLGSNIRNSVDKIECNPGAVGCDTDNLKDQVRKNVNTALESSGGEIAKQASELITAVKEVRDSMKNGKNDLDENVEDIIKQVTDGMYWLFMFFNVLYCIIFGLVLVGTILAAFGRSGGLKTGGFLFVRGAIVIMFILGIVIIVQLMAMFIISGIASEILCPAVRTLEDDPNGSPEGSIRTTELSVTDSSDSTTDTLIVKAIEGREYAVPGFGQVIRDCKNDKSAYQAFNLKNAFDITTLTTLIDGKFEVPDPDPGSSNAGEIINAMKRDVNEYTKCVETIVSEELGRCQPAYLVINSTINLFCDKITAPIASFWWILQFIPLVFILIFVTALFFERVQT